MAKGLTHLAKGLRKRSTVIRFWDNEVLTNTSGVLEAIRERLHRTPSPQSPPLKGGEEVELTPLKGGDVITHTK
jgi:hypothetical protein